jgi:long-chain acyl-CoA synthetase
MSKDFRTLQELARSLDQGGDASCLVWFEPDGPRLLSYAEVGEMAGSAAAGLAARGLGAGDRVVLFALNDWRVAVLSAALGRARAAVAPLDPQLAGDTLEHVLRDAEPSLILGPAEHLRAAREVLGAAMPPALATDAEQGPGSWRSLLDPEQGRAEPAEVAPEDTAALFYTSGTTGPPKGVPLTHANLAFQLQALVDSGLVSPGDRMLPPLPLHHVYPWVVGIWAPLALGIGVVLPEGLAGRSLIRAMREGRATIMLGAPRLYEALVSSLEDRMRSRGLLARTAGFAMLGVSRFARRRLGLRLGKVLFRSLHGRFGPDLRVMASGGAPLPPELAWTLEALGWRVAVGYGLTETSPILCLNPPGAGRFHTVGQPLAGVRVRIDEQAGGDPGTGEVQAAGPGVFHGYRNLPDKSRETFTRDGWLRTGDLGRMEQGRLVVGGRLSTLIVTRSGENVRPDAVEAVLDGHPLLRETGVLERDGRLAVLAVPDLPAARDRALAPEEAARRAVAEASQELASYQRPAVTAVSLDPLERTRLGKIRRHKLEQRFEQARQGVEASELGPVPPEAMAPQDRRLLRNERAEAVWSLLAERYPRRRLRPDSNLAADLGVDSLEWVDLSLALARRAGLELDEQRIAGMDAVRDLLQAAAQGETEGEGRPDPVEQSEAFLDDEARRGLEPASGWRRSLYKSLHAAAWPLFRLLFRLEVRGLEEVLARRREAELPLVIAPNHVSFLDPLLLAAALPFEELGRTHFLGARDVAFANPVFAFFARTAQTAPADPVRRPGQGLAVGAALLGRGRNVVWFPEGRRSLNGELGPFLPGLGRILARREALVAPVAIHGAYEAMPTGRRWFKPVNIRLEFGEPVRAETLRPQEPCEDEAGCVMDALRRRVRGLLEEGATGRAS